MSLECNISGLDELRDHLLSMRIETDGALRDAVRSIVSEEISALRDKAKMAAEQAGGGSASGAVLRRSYQSRLGGAVHILGGRKKYSNDSRGYTPGSQRTVSQRTMTVNRYSGPDRAFILRFLNSGTTGREVSAPSTTGRGSRSSWGYRGSIAARNFFSPMESEARSASVRAAEKIEQLIAKNEK